VDYRLGSESGGILVILLPALKGEKEIFVEYLYKLLNCLHRMLDCPKMFILEL
jgi:hypothetical protein